MEKVGFRVRLHIDKPPARLIDALGAFGTANLGDCMERFQAMNPAIRSFNPPGVKMAGYAVTVKVSPGDNLMIHKAVDIAGEGAVVVVDGGGDLSHSLVGDILVRLAMRRGVRGFVVDGAIRDVDDIVGLGFPIFARGSTPSGPYKDGPGEVNFPIACGGVVVRPGDIVIGDGDGVVVVPPEHAEGVLDRARRLVENEGKIIAAIEDGTVDRSWVDAALREKGCTFV